MFKHYRRMFSLPRLALVNPKGSISLLLSISTVVLHHRDIAAVEFHRPHPACSKSLLCAFRSNPADDD